MNSRRAFLKLLGIGAMTAPAAAKAAQIAIDPSEAFVGGDVLPPGLVMELPHEMVSGWVRLNGRTIGNAASGATERASRDTRELFELLWKNLPDEIRGGRGLRADTDFRSNKTIRLPDLRPKKLFIKL